jgi:hypothetical protein
MARCPGYDKSARSSADIIADPTASFGNLLERARLLLRLERQLRTMLDEALAEHFRVANLRQDCLILLAPTASWATRLRMAAPQLLECLQRSGYAGIESIDVRVGPMPPGPPAPLASKPLSPAAKEALDLMSRLGTESED